MKTCLASRLRLPAWLVLVLGLVTPDLLQAQLEDSSTTQHTIPAEWLEILPVDRATQGLTLEPGVTTDDSGELLLRGGSPEDAALYLDGVPILSAFRSTPFFSLARSRMLESRTSLAPNVVSAATAVTGPLPASLGNGQAGVISLSTRQPGDVLTARLNLETDEVAGSGHSFGLSRLEANVSAPLARGLSLMAAGMLEGQRAVDRGFDGEEAPIFVLAGVDTTVDVPSAFNDPLADTTRVDIYDFAASRGQCEDFSSSGNADIAQNYGFDCQGARTPQSAVSAYELAGKLTYAFGNSRLSLLALADQHQNRNFDYGTLYNIPGITGNRTTSSIIILGWRQALNRSVDRPLVLNAHLSLQSDGERSGPLSPEGEESSRDPFAGLLISPIDLRFDFDNFPVDDELVRNYRTNEAGSRRSPYDLENTAQYSLIDRYRNNAYGLYNRDAVAPVTFPEAGGPLGPLLLYHEDRTLGSASLAWHPTGSQRVELGGEFTRYSISNYSHLLESQNLSDVYIENPIRGTLFLQDRLRLETATITGGVRYDFYRTRARRPADFPRISSHPLFDPADPEAFFTNDALFPVDDQHTYLSPHLQASVSVTPHTVVRGGVATQAQVPDFRQTLLRINTDVAITGLNTVFGTDLDFAHTTIYELGVRHALSVDIALDVAVYSRDAESQVTTRLAPRFDPLVQSTRNLLLLTNEGEERVRGLDLRLEKQAGLFRGWLGYSYQDATFEAATSLGSTRRIPALDSRPHSLTGAVALILPPDWKPGSASGAILRNVSLSTMFRFASGTPYTPCPLDNSVLSPGLCSSFGGTDPNGSRLPTFKQLDLRIAKHFGPDGRFSGYLDARNLLNFRNVVAVFAATGTTDNPAELNTNWAADSADLGTEAQVNARYLPNGTIDLGVGLPDPRPACATWADQAGSPAAPNCVYLIRAEERFGNGDHLFDLTEQRRASDALYRTVQGSQELTGPPRRVRLGLEVGF